MSGARAVVELKFSSHRKAATLDFIEPAERVGFAQILLDFTAHFAPLNRVIKHYQHVFGT